MLIVYAAVAMALLVELLAVAIALRVSVAETVTAPVYFFELVVGVVPSVV